MIYIYINVESELQSLNNISHLFRYLITEEMRNVTQRLQFRIEINPYIDKEY